MVNKTVNDKIKFYRLEQIKANYEYTQAALQNNIIQYIDIDIVGHFNNGSILKLIIRSNKNIIIEPSYDIGLEYSIKRIVELLDLTEEDGLSLRSIRKIPIRLVVKEYYLNSFIIGFGHFMDDKFVLIEDFKGRKKEN